MSELATALLDLMSFFSSPRRDDALLRAAGVKLDRALFPLLVRLAMCGPLSVAGLAAQVGRDHTTISRQLSKLEDMGLVSRQGVDPDRRVRTTALTPDGEAIVRAISATRERLLSTVLADWSEADRESLATLNRRFVDALKSAAGDRA